MVSISSSELSDSIPSSAAISWRSYTDVTGFGAEVSFVVNGRAFVLAALQASIKPQVQHSFGLVLLFSFQWCMCVSVRGLVLLYHFRSVCQCVCVHVCFGVVGVVSLICKPVHS